MEIEAIALAEGPDRDDVPGVLGHQIDQADRPHLRYTFPHRDFRELPASFVAGAGRRGVPRLRVSVLRTITLRSG
jgi:hypothetical protein